MAANHDHHSHDFSHTYPTEPNHEGVSQIVQPLDLHAGHVVHGGHGHSMVFHFGVQEAAILFSFWQTYSVGTMLASCLGIVIVSFLYEGLKYFREYLFWKSYNTNIQYTSVETPSTKNVPRDDQAVTMIGEVITKQPLTIFSRIHAIQTLLHVIQLTISYILMLIFMTFNVYLCFSVVLGAGLGYFFFGWKKPVVVDVTEHCH